MQEITDRDIRELKAAAVATATGERRTLELADRICKGLRVRASYGGSVAFYLIYRPRGERKLKRLLLGKYPSIGIAEARRRGKAQGGKVADGIDPIAQKKAEAAEAKRKAEDAAATAAAIASRITVEKVADKFLHEKRHLRWEPRYRSMLEFNLTKPKLPEMQLGLASKAADDLTAADIDRVIEAIQRRGSEVQARRVYEVIRAMFRWAAKKKIIGSNPLDAVSAPKNAEARKRFLSVLELRTFWTTLAEWDRLWTIKAEEAPPIPQAAIRALRLQLLLATRIGEVSGMKKSELSADGYSWTIPAVRCKNGEEHTLPLPPLAREIIAAAVKASNHPSLVFPVHARGGAEYAGLRSDVIAGHMTTVQEHFGFTDPDGKPAPIVTHDLRRTAATYMRKAGVSSDVVSAILNHKSERAKSVLETHYNQDRLLYPMREALTKWEALLADVAAGQDPFAVNGEDIAELERRVINRTRGAKLTAIGGGKA